MLKHKILYIILTVVFAVIFYITLSIIIDVVNTPKVEQYNEVVEVAYD